MQPLQTSNNPYQLLMCEAYTTSEYGTPPIQIWNGMSDEDWMRTEVKVCFDSIEGYALDRSNMMYALERLRSLDPETYRVYSCQGMHVLIVLNDTAASIIAEELESALLDSPCLDYATAEQTYSSVGLDIDCAYYV